MDTYRNMTSVIEKPRRQAEFPSTPFVKELGNVIIPVPGKVTFLHQVVPEHFPAGRVKMSPYADWYENLLVVIIIRPASDPTHS